MTPLRQHWKTTTLGAGTAFAIMQPGFDTSEVGSWLRLAAAVITLVAGFFARDK